MENISYPKDCYPSNGYFINGKSINNIGKIKVTKEQYKNIINEIRCWENNIHLELNLGKYFKIIKENYNG
tara:strand:+ start:1353 stop:1562 length:210 start_codon:yes stop_codon:yes gene_type:complete